MLCLPADPQGLVVFADTGIAARARVANEYLDAALRGARLATLWLDLLGRGEQRNQPPDAAMRSRLDAICGWHAAQPEMASLPVGLFGSGYAGAAALELAAARPRCICAVVTRGAHVDLVAIGTLTRIAVPTLLIAGGLDDTTIAANRGAYAALRCKKRLEIIPGATSDFGEPGSPEVVARLTRGWFLQHAHFAAA